MARTEEWCWAAPLDALIATIRKGDAPALKVGELRLKADALTAGEKAALKSALKTAAAGPGAKRKKPWPPRGEVRGKLMHGTTRMYRLVVDGRSLELDFVDVHNPDPLLKQGWTWRVNHTAAGEIRAVPVPVPPKCKPPRPRPPAAGGMGVNA